MGYDSRRERAALGSTSFFAVSRSAAHDCRTAVTVRVPFHNIGDSFKLLYMDTAPPCAGPCSFAFPPVSTYWHWMALGIALWFAVCLSPSMHRAGIRLNHLPSTRLLLKSFSSGAPSCSGLPGVRRQRGRVGKTLSIFHLHVLLAPMPL